MKRIINLAAASAIGLAGFSAAAQDKIAAVHAFPGASVYTKSFLDYVRKANEAGKGAFEIQVRGGPEAIGMFEQPNAVRDGVVDMVYTPCAFYAGAVPECDAVSASTRDGPTVRRNGGMDLLNQIHQRRHNVFYLGWIDSGIRFHIWSSKQPRLDAQGNLDVKGFKVRGNPIYNAFFTSYLGAQVLNMPNTEIYTALERGTIDISGWTSIGLMDFNWDRYLKWRVDPEFFSTDLGIIINLKKWTSLSPRTKEILTRVVIEHEQSSMKALAELRVKEWMELEKRGMKVVSLTGDAGKRFAAEARKASFARMKERMEKAGGMENYERMIGFYAPN